MRAFAASSRATRRSRSSGEAATGAEALTRVPLAKPDVAILDVRLEDGNGIEVCRDLRSAMPDLVCLMLTSFADDEAHLRQRDGRAAGYVLKQIKARDLIEDVKKVAAGRRSWTRGRWPGWSSGSPIHPRLTAMLVPLPPGGTHPGPHRRGEDQPPDRRGHVPVGEHGEELHDRPAAQAQDDAAGPRPPSTPPSSRPGIASNAE